MKTLAIDIGNSNLVFAYWNGTRWQAVWREETSITRPADDYARGLRMQMLEHGLRFSDVEQVILGSVVPALTKPVAEMVGHTLELETLVMSPALLTKLPITVVNLAEIGVDLVANALAAYTRFQQAVIVVDFGTALTLTSVSDAGRIEGVAIAPGLKTAIRALASNTAQLPEVPLLLPTSVLGKDTAHAMQVGVLEGYIGMVRHLLAQTRRELGMHAQAIATGGLSGVLAPLHTEFAEIDTLLTLEGLRLAAHYATPLR